MITGMVIQVLHCRHCQSADVTRHGGGNRGTQRYRCHICHKTFRERPGSAAHPEAIRAQVLGALEERRAMRGVCCLLGVSHQTLSTWLKKSRVAADRYLPAYALDVP